MELQNKNREKKLTHQILNKMYTLKMMFLYNYNFKQGLLQKASI